ncbi:MAG: tetratricopeptide repeat protein [Treponemataceae bacterium]|nr:tetratricopeptide repeat protein [Treponemataceae bacterium]
MNKKVGYMLLTVSAVSLLFLAALTGCASKPESVPQPPVEIPAEPEPEVFTEEGFIVRLQRALRESTVEDALALYDELPEEYADDFDLLYLKATLLFSIADYEGAAAQADELEEIDPVNTDLMMLRMMLAKASGNAADKQKVLQDLLKVDPTNTDANTELGDEWMLKRNFKKANQYYIKALAGDANNVDALLGYGQSCYYLGELQKAQDTFEKLTSVDPTNAFAWSFLAKLDCEYEDYASAIKNIRHALDLEPEFYDYWVDYGLYLNHRNLNQEAIDAWTRAIELRPDYFLAYVYRGGIYDSLNRLEDALNDFVTVTKLNKEYYYADESIAVLLWGLQDYTRSRAWFEKTLELYPSSKSYYMMIALTYFMEGTKEAKKQGRDYLNKVVMKKYSKDSAEYAVARLFYDNLQPAQVDTKVKAITNANERGRWLFYLGMYFHINGNDEMAYKYYSEVDNIQSAQFFEFRLNEWAMKGINVK